MIKLLPISDLHATSHVAKRLEARFPDVTDIDFITISGDVMERGQDPNLVRLKHLLEWQPGCKIVFTSGNHDYNNYRELIRLNQLEDRVIYLENEYRTVDGLIFYGCPHTTPFFNWNYMLPEEGIKRVLNETMCEGIDVALMHSPPCGMGDRVTERYVTGEDLGSYSVREALNKFKPRYVFWGHIHSATKQWYQINDVTRGRNVSILDEWYDVDLENTEIVEVAR